MRKFTFVFILLFLSLVNATTPTDKLKNALNQLCVGVQQLVPIAAMLMILLGSVIYSVGQMMGAETRARATVWATSCLTGAIIGIIIATVSPSLLGIIVNNGTPLSCSPTTTIP